MDGDGVIHRRERTEQECIDLHLADGRAPMFDQTGQKGRILKARSLLNVALRWAGHKAKIIELGCGAADISGPFAEKHDVLGVDVVLAAEQAAKYRFPHIRFLRERLERVEPVECDVLILCEVLEHIADPMAIVEKWLPLAGASIIGHPLSAPDEDPEEGHCWSFTQNDFTDWFVRGGHELKHQEIFEMTCYKKMALGIGRRMDGVPTSRSAGPTDD
jgi:hypothetical protein